MHMHMPSHMHMHIHIHVHVHHVAPLGVPGGHLRWYNPNSVALLTLTLPPNQAELVAMAAARRAAADKLQELQGAIRVLVRGRLTLTLSLSQTLALTPSPTLRLALALTLNLTLTPTLTLTVTRCAAGRSRAPS